MSTLVWMVLAAPAVAGTGGPLDGSIGGLVEAEAERPRRTSEDGRWWWYALPPDGVPTGPRVEGALTWRYVGQVRFEVDPVPAGPGWSRVPEQVRTRMDDDPEAYLGVGAQTMVDADGRLWVLDSVDVAAAYDAVDAYDSAVRAAFGTEAGMEDETGLEAPPDAGRMRYGVPHAWTFSECDAYNTGYEVSQWSGAMLAPITTALNERQRKIVMVQRYASGVLKDTCSGVMVDDEWLLTTAHCAASGTAAYAPGSFVVCTYGNLQTGATCRGVVASVVRGGRYTGGWEDDYAVLKLASPTSGIGWFALSQAADSVIDDYPQYHRAYPYYEPDCDLNVTDSNALTVHDAYFGATMYTADGLITGTSSGYVAYDLSSALGMSGGAVFYCPNAGGCDNGHYLTAIEAGYATSWFGATHQYGPKASAIRDWVIQYTP